MVAHFLNFMPRTGTSEKSPLKLPFLLSGPGGEFGFPVKKKTVLFYYQLNQIILRLHAALVKQIGRAAPALLLR